jgi:hypothetical protein
MANTERHHLADAALYGSTRAGCIHKHLPHQSSDDSIKVRPIFVGRMPASGKLQKCFMHQGRGLQRHGSELMPQMGLGEFL